MTARSPPPHPPTLPGPHIQLRRSASRTCRTWSTAPSRTSREPGPGWVLADDPPWPGAVVDSTLAGTRSATRRQSDAGADGVQIRELPRTEVGPWAEVIVAASDLPEAIATAWRNLERRTGARSRTTIGSWPRSTGRRSVRRASTSTTSLAGCAPAPSSPTHRGRGIQRALIAHRALTRAAGRDLVGAIGRSTGAARQPTSSAAGSGASGRGAAIGSSRPPDRRDGGARACGAWRSVDGSSGRVRRGWLARCAPPRARGRTTSRSRTAVEGLGGRVDSEMRCAASHATPWDHAERVEHGLGDAPRPWRHAHACRPPPCSSIQRPQLIDPRRQQRVRHAEHDGDPAASSW